MNCMKQAGVSLISASVFWSAAAGADVSVQQIKDGLTGCFIVDYSFSEAESLDPEYNIDPRVYDVGGYTVKELVRAVDQEESSVRVQHFMQAENFAGETTFMMRHHGEIWQKSPSQFFNYQGRFDGNDRWNKEFLEQGEQERWVRSVTSLDDGLRYQCVGSWHESQAFPRFGCDAFAPIPGRETRDMGRSDYNTMQRHAEVRLYGESWLEKQYNQKIRFDRGERRPLAAEVGKIWSVRIPMSECADVEQWADQRQRFWDILADVWQTAYDQDRPFNEIKLVDGSSRGAKISALEEEYYATVAQNAEHEQIVRQRLAEIIEAHRE